MAKIVTMGEIMLRLSTPNNEKFIQAEFLWLTMAMTLNLLPQYRLTPLVSAQ